MEPLSDEVVEWLRAERKEYADAARRLGLPQSLPHLKPVAVNVEEQSLGLQYEHADRSSLNSFMIAERIAQEAREARRVTSPAEHLLSTYGDECWVWTARRQPEFEKTAVPWIDMNLLQPLLGDYLRRLTSLDVDDLDLATKSADGLMQLIKGTVVNLVTSLPLAGIRFESDVITRENITFRRLSLAELGELFEATTPTMNDVPSRRPIIPPRHEITSERWMLEMREPCVKTKQPVAGYRLSRVLLALQLLGFEPHGQGAGMQATEPGPSLWHGWQRYRLPGHGSTRTCTEAELESALRLAEAMPESVIIAPTARHELALHRFSVGAAEEEVADALIDYVIALEAALPSERQELRFRLSLYAASFLETEPAMRRRTFDQLWQAYGVRSTLVHGSSAPSPETVKAASRVSRDIAGRVLAKGLLEGWPTEKQLRGEAIGPRLGDSRSVS